MMSIFIYSASQMCILEQKSLIQRTFSLNFPYTISSFLTSLIILNINDCIFPAVACSKLLHTEYFSFPRVVLFILLGIFLCYLKDTYTILPFVTSKKKLLLAVFLRALSDNINTVQNKYY